MPPPLPFDPKAIMMSGASMQAQRLAYVLGKTAAVDRLYSMFFLEAVKLDAKTDEEKLRNSRYEGLWHYCQRKPRNRKPETLGPELKEAIGDVANLANKAISATGLL
ncbi:MAG: hypothetical protein HY784_05135, partial [Chloroflexi bacterium]|nr:hypothetical protein [Chloroflexota bacterium]